MGRRPFGLIVLGMMSARLLVGLIVFLVAGSQRRLLFVLAGLCVLVLLAWEVWWWRTRRR